MNRALLSGLLFYSFTQTLSIAVLAAAEISEITIGDKESGSYVAFGKKGPILFDQVKNPRKKVAYLVIDDNGRPAVYPSPIVNQEKGHLNSLCNISQKEAKAILNLEPLSDGLYSGKLIGWNTDAKDWASYILDLKFSNGSCKYFKVSGPGVSRNKWISADQIPDNITTKNSPKSLPPYILCVEGPSDMSDCGVAIP